MLMFRHRETWERKRRRWRSICTPSFRFQASRSKIEGNLQTPAQTFPPSRLPIKHDIITDHSYMASQGEKGATRKLGHAKKQNQSACMVVIDRVVGIFQKESVLFGCGRGCRTFRSFWRHIAWDILSLCISGMWTCPLLFVGGESELALNGQWWVVIQGGLDQGRAGGYNIIIGY